jgi:hypothetical protein
MRSHCPARTSLRLRAGILLGVFIGALATACTHVPPDRKDAADTNSAVKGPLSWTFDTGG